MFKRPDENYAIDEGVIAGILNDEAQPLRQIAMLIPDGSTVLDIGAGSGTLGRVLQAAGKHVTADAIEPNQFAANLAMPFYRKVHSGYAQDYYDEISQNEYDYVVLADVIEHIVDPLSFLEELLAALPAATKLIISIPNVAFGGVRLALMNGRFNYVDSGLLERTHLRFFTLESIRKLFFVMHLFPERIIYLERSFYRVEFDRKDLRASLMNVWKLARSADARAYQYLFVLSKDADQTPVVDHYGATAMRVMLDAMVMRPLVKRLGRMVLRGR